MNGLICVNDAIRNYWMIVRINFEEEITLEMVDQCTKKGYYGDIIQNS